MNWSRNTSAPSRSRNANWTTPTPRSRPRTANAPWFCAASATSVRSASPTICRHASIPTGPRSSLLAGILTQQPNGRLYKALVESKKATSANASAGNNHDPGLFTLSAQAEPGQLEAVRDTLIATLENLAAVPFTGGRSRPRPRCAAVALKNGSRPTAWPCRKHSVRRRHWAIGGCCSSSATASRLSLPRTSTASPRPTSKSTIAPLASTSRWTSRSGLLSPRLPPWKRW